MIRRYRFCASLRPDLVTEQALVRLFNSHDGLTRGKGFECKYVGLHNAFLCASK